MDPLSRLIRRYVGANLQAGIRTALNPVAPYLRRLLGGVVLVLLAGLALSAALSALLLALFFGFSDNAGGLDASLKTAGVSAVIAVLLGALGFGRIRPPRRR